jgi:hypothetical protein
MMAESNLIMKRIATYIMVRCSFSICRESSRRRKTGRQRNITVGDVISIGRTIQTMIEHRLSYALKAPLNSYYRQHKPTCLSEICVDALCEILGWADTMIIIFWLNGLAGTRKVYDRSSRMVSFVGCSQGE